MESTRAQQAIKGRMFVVTATHDIDHPNGRTIKAGTSLLIDPDATPEGGRLSFPRFFVCQRTDFMLPVFPDVAR